MTEWTCQDVFENLSRYVDGDLAAEERAAFESHIQSCERCQQFGDEFFRAIEALRLALDVPSREREDAVIQMILDNAAG